MRHCAMYNVCCFVNENNNRKHLCVGYPPRLSMDSESSTCLRPSSDVVLLPSRTFCCDLAGEISISVHHRRHTCVGLITKILFRRRCFFLFCYVSKVSETKRLCLTSQRLPQKMRSMKCLMHCWWRILYFYRNIWLAASNRINWALFWL